MKQQKTVESRVLEILKECPMSRYDDMLLISFTEEIPFLHTQSEQEKLLKWWRQHRSRKGLGFVTSHCLLYQIT
jgi:hypothetical protein